MRLRNGPAGAAGGCLLLPLSCAYAGVAAVRNFFYYHGVFSSVQLPRPVVSIGNVTAGGTGKTPATLMLYDRLAARGGRPAVLSRGYGGDGRTNDEMDMFWGRHPGALMGVGADRIHSARQLLQDHPEISCFILDDGFQHRRIRRDLDIVLIDAGNPFGGGWCLPSGFLREPARGLRRAQIIIITKTDEVPRATLDAIRSALSDLRCDAPVLEAAHRAVALVPLDGRRPPEPLENLKKSRVHLMSAIARPGSFESVITGLGATVISHIKFRDHHRYTPAELPELRPRSRGEFWCTTEKDAAKLRKLGVVDGYYLKIEFVITKGAGDLDAHLDRMVSRKTAALSGE